MNGNKHGVEGDYQIWQQWMNIGIIFVITELYESDLGIGQPIFMMIVLAETRLGFLWKSGWTL